jgi:transcriptional regulator with XRE-family HTH domain
LNTFGGRLRSARKNKNISQRKLAEIIGAKHTSISEWENGYHEPKDIETINKICATLQIEASWLLNNSNKESKISLYLNKGIDDLPDDAKRELDNFVDYLKIKYKKGDKK